MSNADTHSRNAIMVVALREIQTILRSKSIVISLALTPIVSVGVIIGFSIYSSGDDGSGDTRPSLAVVGADLPEEAAPALALVSVCDENSAHAVVENGQVDGALILGSHPKLIVNGTPNPLLATSASELASSMGVNDALVDLGVDPAQFAQRQPAPMETVNLEDEDTGGINDENGLQVITTLVGTAVIIMFIILFAGTIGGRVTEEKSSRIIELILATVRPMHFLTGKMLGNLIFGLGASAVFLLINGTALYFSGLLDGVEFSFSVLPLLVVSFVIGLLFFGCLYVAAGSMVSRTEDLQSTSMPIMLLVFGVIYVPAFGFMALDSTFMRVMSWIPPFSISTAPLQYAAGNWELWQVLASFVIALVATVAVLALTARIYKNSVLRNGQKMKWVQAIKG